MWQLKASAKEIEGSQQFDISIHLMLIAYLLGDGNCILVVTMTAYLFCFYNKICFAEKWVAPSDHILQNKKGKI